MGQKRFLGAIQRNGSSSGFTRAECRRQLLTFFFKAYTYPCLWAGLARAAATANMHLHPCVLQNRPRASLRYCRGLTKGLFPTPFVRNKEQ